MEFTVANILSIIALLVAGSLGAWIRIMSKRSFKASDDAITLLQKDQGKIKEDISSLKDQYKNLEHAISSAKNLDGFRLEMSDKFLDKPTFSRELSLITNQIQSIHPKIEQLEGKIESLRDKRR